MTPKEAIDNISEIQCIVADAVPACDPEDDLGRYTIALNIAIKALEKQIPKKVKKEILTSNAFTQWRKYNCPNCGCFLYSGASKPFSAQSHCHQCGQKLSFEGLE